jgi:hypothetical protein
MAGVSGMRLAYVAKAGIAALRLNASSKQPLGGGYSIENTGAEGRRATFLIAR